MKDWVLVTRTDEQIEDLRRALAVHGLDTLAYPVLQEVDHDDEHAWSELSRRLTEISLLALTSPRAALPLLQGARRRGLWDSLSALPAAVIGHATAAAAAAAGLTVAVVGHGGGAVLAALVNDHWPAARLVLHVCGRDHRPELADNLRDAGVEVVELPVYAAEITAFDRLPELPAAQPVAVVLSSPRATEGYASAVGSRFKTVPHVAFGRATAAAATRLGFANVVVAGPGVDALVEEICQIC